MNTYQIQHKINTLSELLKPFTYKEFTFERWIEVGSPNEYYSNNEGWKVTKTVQAGNATEAINNFRKELFHLINKLTIVSQCCFSFELESHLIFKENENLENIFFLFYTKEQEGVGLHFDTEEILSLRNLEGFNNNEALYYFRESNNAITYTSRVLLLCIALESLAGRVTIIDPNTNETKQRYDREKMKEILNDNTLYDEVFGYNGIRHKLAHGEFINSTDKNYAVILYKKICSYFNRTFNTQINNSAVDVPRSLYENYRTDQGWFKLIDQDLNLINLVENFENEEVFSRTMQPVEMPVDY